MRPDARSNHPNNVYNSSILFRTYAVRRFALRPRKGEACRNQRTVAENGGFDKLNQRFLCKFRKFYSFLRKSYC